MRLCCSDYPDSAIIISKLFCRHSFFHPLLCFTSAMAENLFHPGAVVLGVEEESNSLFAVYFCILYFFVFLYLPLLESYFVFFKGMGGAACDRPSLRVQRDLRAELADDEKVAISNSAFL